MHHDVGLVARVVCRVPIIFIHRLVADFVVRGPPSAARLLHLHGELDGRARGAVLRHGKPRPLHVGLAVFFARFTPVVGAHEGRAVRDVVADASVGCILAARVGQRDGVGDLVAGVHTGTRRIGFLARLARMQQRGHGRVAHLVDGLVGFFVRVDARVGFGVGRLVERRVLDVGGGIFAHAHGVAAHRPGLIFPETLHHPLDVGVAACILPHSSAVVGADAVRCIRGPRGDVVAHSRERRLRITGVFRRQSVGDGSLFLVSRVFLYLRARRRVGRLVDRGLVAFGLLDRQRVVLDDVRPLVGVSVRIWRPLVLVVREVLNQLRRILVHPHLELDGG